MHSLIYIKQGRVHRKHKRQKAEGRGHKADIQHQQRQQQQVPSLPGRSPMDMNLELTVTIGFSVVGGKSNIGVVNKLALPLPPSETRIQQCLNECKEVLEKSMRVPGQSAINLNLELTATIGWSVVGGKSNIGVMNKLALPLPLSETRIKQCLDECKEVLEKFMSIQPYRVKPSQPPQSAAAAAEAEEKKKKRKHATAIMREIAREVADRRGIPSISCTLHSFETSIENRKFCVDALEKRCLFGRGGYAMYVRDGYEEEYRNRMRTFITDVVCNRSKYA